MTPTETGSPPVSRRTWWVVGILGVLAMSAVAVWFGLAATSGRVHWVDTGHSITSDAEATVRFDLLRDADRPVTCELVALDERKAPVGTSVVEVGPSESSPSRHTATLRTVTRAVTASVDRCWYSDEERPGTSG